MIDFERLKMLEKLQQRIEYTFKDVSLLDTALTHTSYVKGEGKALMHNERLEFLGDAVLELAVSADIFQKHPELNEGKMTKVRALTVCEESLCDVACRYELGDMLRLSKGESNSGGRQKPSILSDALEALIGAIYLDGGFERANAFIMKFAPDFIGDAVNGALAKDHKTALQELVQSDHKGTLEYVLVAAHGPDHKKQFEMQVLLDKKVLGEGMGHSKQEAGQNAAKAALEILKNKS